MLEKELVSLAEKHPVEGFWKCYNRIRNEGAIVNHKKLYRIYKQIGLSLRRKTKKRLPARVKETIEIPNDFTHTWSIDFMSDALTKERKFRTFNVIDDYNREVLHIEIDKSLKSSRVIWVLNHLIHKIGKPKRIRMDNGPEFIANIAQVWSELNDIEFKYIQPGKPTQNALIERFNRTFRENILDRYIFNDLNEAREITEEWVNDYNNYRPHDALKGMPPIKYRLMMKNRIFEVDKKPLEGK
jgi:putative transposase